MYIAHICYILAQLRFEPTPINEKYAKDHRSDRFLFGASRITGFQCKTLQNTNIPHVKSFWWRVIYKHITWVFDWTVADNTNNKW